MIYTAVGGGNSGGDPFAMQGAVEARKATLTINLTPRHQRSGTSKQAIEAQLRQAAETLPGARVKVGMEGGGKNYQLVLASERLATTVFVGAATSNSAEGRAGRSQTKRKPPVTLIVSKLTRAATAPPTAFDAPGASVCWTHSPAGNADASRPIIVW